MALKNPKNCPKTQNQPEIKNLTKMICVFLDNFKVKKKNPNESSLHQKK